VASGAVDVEGDVLVRVLRLQVEELRDDSLATASLMAVPRR
jgi:hypothetical protein